jgi:hypothetical protein
MKQAEKRKRIGLFEPWSGFTIHLADVRMIMYRPLENSVAGQKLPNGIYINGMWVGDGTREDYECLRDAAMAYQLSRGEQPNG